jgi:Beta-lactamase enzyme family
VPVEPRATTRRRRARLLLTVTIIAVTGTAGGAYALRANVGSDAGIARIARTAAHTVAVAGRTVSVGAAALRPGDPFRARSLRGYLRGRHDATAAAVEDLRSGRVWVYHPGRREQTASIMKVDILETLLHEQQNAGGLSTEEAELADGMIENSNNDDAQDLWDGEGGSGAVGTYDTLAGLTDTSPDTAGYWGLSYTTAPDQIALLRQLIVHDGILSRSSQDDELSLMSDVEADQRWGVSGGVPAGARIAIKNGWLPLSAGDWQVNSIGRVSGDGRRYLIAVLTDGNPTEAYGIATIEHISAFVWRDLAR